MILQINELFKSCMGSWMYGNRKYTFRKVVCEVLSFAGNPVQCMLKFTLKTIVYLFSNGVKWYFFIPQILPFKLSIRYIFMFMQSIDWLINLRTKYA